MCAAVSLPPPCLSARFLSVGLDAATGWPLPRAVAQALRQHAAEKKYTSPYWVSTGSLAKLDLKLKQTAVKTSVQFTTTMLLFNIDQVRNVTALEPFRDEIHAVWYRGSWLPVPKEHPLHTSLTVLAQRENTPRRLWLRTHLPETVVTTSQPKAVRVPVTLDMIHISQLQDRTVLFERGYLRCRHYWGASGLPISLNRETNLLFGRQRLKYKAWFLPEELDRLGLEPKPDEEPVFDADLQHTSVCFMLSSDHGTNSSDFEPMEQKIILAAAGTPPPDPESSMARFQVHALGGGKPGVIRLLTTAQRWVTASVATLPEYASANVAGVYVDAGVVESLCLPRFGRMSTTTGAAAGQGGGVALRLLRVTERVRPFNIEQLRWKTQISSPSATK